jgi:acetyl-CoA carboxylase biotin carboxyl carrier protein
MNQKELKELIEFLIEKDIAEFELERGDVKVRIKRGAEPVASASAPDARFFTVHAAPPPAPEIGASPVPGTVPPPPPAIEKAPVPEEGFHIVRSPIVGTFYESPSPGSPPFVKPGDVVEAGQILCIVEAMKLMNQIKSEVAGRLMEILVKNGQAVEFDQPLFRVDPAG